jgi:hypothetical protein
MRLKMARVTMPANGETYKRDNFPSGMGLQVRADYRAS